jgi:hypothetical protein
MLRFSSCCQSESLFRRLVCLLLGHGSGAAINSKFDKKY